MLKTTYMWNSLAKQLSATRTGLSRNRSGKILLFLIMYLCHIILSVLVLRLWEKSLSKIRWKISCKNYLTIKLNILLTSTDVRTIIFIFVCISGCWKFSEVYKQETISSISAASLFVCEEQTDENGNTIKSKGGGLWTVQLKGLCHEMNNFLKIFNKK